MMFCKLLWPIALLSTVQCLTAAVDALPRFDFTYAAAVAGWEPTHDIARIEATAEGMRISISGNDPYSCGPARDYPKDSPLFLCVRLNSDMPGMFQVFYFTDQIGPSEEASVRTFVKGRRWETVRVAMPALGPRSRLRIDPPGNAGACTISAVWFEQRALLPEPPWPVPVPPTIGANALRVKSGTLELAHAPDKFGAFSVSVDGKPMAVGHTSSLIGYQTSSGLHWINLENLSTRLAAENGGLVIRTICTDADASRPHQRSCR